MMGQSVQASDGNVTRVVLITGAAKRIGRETALLMAKQGWSVAVHYGHSRTEAETTVADLRACGIQAQSFQADLSVESQVQDLADQVLAYFGRFDAVVNNASRFEFDEVLSLDAQSLMRHMLPNVLAPIVLARCLYRHIEVRRQEGEASAQGVVVNLLDQKLWNYNPDFFAYTLSKAALESASTMMAQALAPLLRVVGVAPGLTMISHLQTPEQFTAAQSMSPLGYSSQAQDIAKTVAFVIDNAAMTGSTVMVDGGQHLMKFERDFSFMDPSSSV